VAQRDFTPRPCNEVGRNLYFNKFKYMKQMTVPVTDKGLAASIKWRALRKCS
jgi:hypothetical protein